MGGREACATATYVHTLRVGLAAIRGVLWKPGDVVALCTCTVGQSVMTLTGRERVPEAGWARGAGLWLTGNSPDLTLTIVSTKSLRALS